VASRPDAQLLPNGDILAPARSDDGGWRVVRLTVDDAGYAEQLAALQKRERQRNPSCTSWFLSLVVLVFVLYLVAFVLQRAL
jgi:hypothetical protein